MSRERNEAKTERKQRKGRVQRKTENEERKEGSSLGRKDGFGKEGVKEGRRMEGNQAWSRLCLLCLHLWL